MKKRTLEEGEEEEGTLAKRLRSAEEDTYWTMLEEMRGEVESHLTLVERFDLLRTRKDQFTAPAQRALLVDALWHDIFVPMYAGRKTMPRMFTDDNTMGVFDNVAAGLIAFTKKKDASDVMFDELDALSEEEGAALLAPEQLKAYLQSLPLADLKTLYKHFVDDMSYAYAKSIGDWMLGLLHDYGEKLYDHTRDKESLDSRGHKRMALGVAICDRHGNQLYKLVFSLVPIPLADDITTAATGKALTPLLLPMITLYRDTRADAVEWARPYREPSNLERERVRQYEQHMARLCYNEKRLTLAISSLNTDALMPLLRTLLLSVDANLFLHFDYRILQELLIDPAHIPEPALRPFEPNARGVIRSVRNQMAFREIMKKKEKEKEKEQESEDQSS